MAIVDVSTEIVIARPRHEVARYAADPDNVPEWYVNIRSVQWKTDRPAVLGSQVAFVAHFLGRRLEYTYEIVELIPGEKLVMRTAQGPFPMETTYTWAAISESSTLMSLRNRGRPAGFSALLAPLLALMVRRATRKDLALLKRLLEDESAAFPKPNETARRGKADLGREVSEKPSEASSPIHFHHGLYEVHLAVTDVGRSIDFYVEKLGFELGFGGRDGPSALLRFIDGDTRWMLGLFQVDSVTRRHAADCHISFRISEEDIDGMIPYLRERGVEAIHPPTAPQQGPMYEPMVHGWMPAAAVFFVDPDGHLLELIADLSDEPRPDFQYRSLSEWRTLVDSERRV